VPVIIGFDCAFILAADYLGVQNSQRTRRAWYVCNSSYCELQLSRYNPGEVAVYSKLCTIPCQISVRSYRERQGNQCFIPAYAFLVSILALFRLIWNTPILAYPNEKANPHRLVSMPNDFNSLQQMRSVLSTYL